MSLPCKFSAQVNAKLWTQLNAWEVQPDHIAILPGLSDLDSSSSSREIRAFASTDTTMFNDPGYLCAVYDFAKDFAALAASDSCQIDISSNWPYPSSIIRMIPPWYLSYSCEVQLCPHCSSATNVIFCSSLLPVHCLEDSKHQTWITGAYPLASQVIRW